MIVSRLCPSCHRLKHALNCPRRRVNRKRIVSREDKAQLPPNCSPEDQERILSGHVYRIDGDRAIFMEDVVMESRLGRKLAVNERVRHKNDDFLDNCDANLELVTA